MTRARISLAALVVQTGLLFGACSPADQINPTAALTAVPISLSAQPSPIPSLIPTATLLPIQNTPSPQPTLTPTVEPGCVKPPEDYTLITLNGGMRINRRTLAMLQQAAQIYHGEIQITGSAITQGSYHDEPGGYGTHTGGGVIDLSVMRPGSYTVLTEDIPLLIHALRRAGFAAWLRLPDELYDGSPIHIHAVAVGDRTLSPAAQAQVTGTDGYFAGFTGNPAPGKKPTPDRYGGPVVCDWMREEGY